MATKQAVEKDDAATEPRRRGNGVQKVYDKLRQSILELSLPPGSPLDEMRLSEEFNLSRTPILVIWRLLSMRRKTRIEGKRSR